jgi:hypothetical protein
MSESGDVTDLGNDVEPGLDISEDDADLSNDVEPGLDLSEDVDMDADVTVRSRKDEPMIGIESHNALSDLMELDDCDSLVHVLDFPVELRRSTRNANAKNQPTVKLAMTQTSSSGRKKPVPKKDEFLLQASFPKNHPKQGD